MKFSSIFVNSYKQISTLHLALVIVIFTLDYSDEFNAQTWCVCVCVSVMINESDMCVTYNIQ